jgi:hypothetical protein
VEPVQGLGESEDSKPRRDDARMGLGIVRGLGERLEVVDERPESLIDAPRDDGKTVPFVQGRRC